MTEKFEFIDAEYAIYLGSGEQYVPSIVKMCIWMEVSRSGFYGWRDKPQSATAKRRGILALYVRKSFSDSDDTYGYRRVHADLAAWGVPVGPRRPRRGPVTVRQILRSWIRGPAVLAAVASGAVPGRGQCLGGRALSRTGRRIPGCGRDRAR